MADRIKEIIEEINQRFQAQPLLRHFIDGSDNACFVNISSFNYLWLYVEDLNRCPYQML